MEVSSSVPTNYNSKSLDEIRRSMKFHPTIWGDYFLSYNSDKTEITVGEHEEHAHQKEMVKKLLAQVSDDSIYKLELIDAIQRLGVEYHFEKEIDDSLRYIHEHYKSKHDDLSTLALRFRLLRQQGYNISCDLFKNFINKQGDFEESIKNNVEGLLQLYEAAHFGKNGEEILEKAVEYCSSHLQASLHHISNVSLSKRVEEALKTPILKGVPRLAAKRFISMYEEDEQHNDIVLNFAKIDFNIVQKMHQRELSEATRWWKKLDVANKMPYARDRIVELFFWMVGVYFEPQYAAARRIIIKAIGMASIIDDTYEYATLGELQILTNAIQRWDVNEELKDSPPHIQICYRSLIQCYLEIEDDIEKAEELYRVQYSKQQMKKLVASYFEEAKWMYNDYIPTVEEYMKVSLVSGGYMMLSTTSLVGMGDVVRKQDFDWVVNEPLIVRACSIISRLMDDLVGESMSRKPHCWIAT